MEAKDRILDLQRAQLRHDEVYHQDILVLDTARRAKHMTLHNAKYAARFLSASEDSENELFNRTLTDAFIISLATANIFSQDLAAKLPAEHDDVSTLSGLGAAIAEGGDRRGSFVRVYAEYTGEMAKACESLDHLEDYPFRKSLTRANRGIFNALLSEAACRQIDLEEAYSERIAEVEGKSPRRLLL